MSTNISREALLLDAARDEYDTVVVGGGITGACAAWDASTRGLRVLLLERADFGADTSAHSLKILHGGIRYLQHLDFHRLRASCRERRAFLHMAPHLTSSEPFVVPTYGRGLQGKNVFRAAFALLAILTADRNKRITDDQQKIPNGYTISREEVLRRFPGVNANRLTGAAVFNDGILLNPPRLVFEIIRTAMDAGTIAVNYCNVTQVKVDSQSNSVSAVRAEDQVSGRTYEFPARSVINAAGPYAPWLAVSGEDRASSTPLSRDMAFVIDRVSDDPATLAVQTRYKDPDAILTRGNRHIFMVPWHDYTLIGVHSRVFSEHPDSLEVTDSEISEFIDEINEAYPSLGLSRQDIRAVNAGLLPFGENEAGAQNLSFGKRSLVTDHSDNGGPRGLITAISVRWTMGRATAQEAVDRIEKLLYGRTSQCQTSQLRIRGSEYQSKEALWNEIHDDEFFGGLTAKQIESLGTNYGSNWKKIKESALEDSSLARPIRGTSTLRGQILIAARDEMAISLSDTVLRRTDIGSGAQPSDAVLIECAEIMSRELNWSDSKLREEVDSVKRLYPFYKSRITSNQIASEE